MGTINGTPFNDTLEGTEDADAIYGFGGRDWIDGNGGDDTIDGGDGDDVLDGGISGNDTLTGGLGNDDLAGRGGNDSFRDTVAGLNGDMIEDFSRGDRIVFTDADVTSFSFSITGNTLNYTGGSLAFRSALDGMVVASAAEGGGVQLVVLNVTAAVGHSGDFNGDGRDDIFWYNEFTANVSDWLGLANGGFVDNAANAYAKLYSSGWHIAGSGDFNGDGRDDILLHADSIIGTGEVFDQVNVWLGQANGGFLDKQATSLTSVPPSWHIAGVGDFNGDGRDDILWRNDDGRLSDWLGTTSGGFFDNAANALEMVPTSWHVAGVGDFNGDGRDDILWRNNEGRMTDWLGASNGGFVDNAANASTDVPMTWQAAAVGDFNGDGRDDILWRNDNGNLSDWLGQANGGFFDNAANAFTFVPISWHVEGVGDYNGDGRDDILWRNDNGNMSDWLGQSDGGFLDNAANAFTFVPTGWHTQPEIDLV
jgi:hypothetical protein